MAFVLGHTSSVVRGGKKKKISHFSSIYESLKKVQFSYDYRRLVKVLQC